MRKCNAYFNDELVFTMEGPTSFGSKSMKKMDEWIKENKVSNGRVCIDYIDDMFEDPYNLRMTRCRIWVNDVKKIDNYEPKNPIILTDGFYDDWFKL